LTETFPTWSNRNLSLALFKMLDKVFSIENATAYCIGTMTFSITTLSTKGLYVTLRINDTEHYNSLHYAECGYSECPILCIAMLNVIMLNVLF